MMDTFGRRPNSTPPHSNDPAAGPASRDASPARDVAGERRVITVLFSDVVGSTSLAGRFDPEEWAEVMNEAFQYLIAPIEEYGGMVARLMGDGVLAFFGAPQAHEDDPQRAVLAGLGIVNGIRTFARRFEQDYGLEFDVRVGINTGPVVVGEIGTSQSGEYTAMGDAINLAARMEQTAAPGTVQITEETYRLIAPLFDVWDLGGVEVKGKEEPVQAYRVLGLEPQPGRLRGLEGIRSPLIGRRRELDRLREILTGLTEHKSRICYLIGEAGLGKSRLIAELRRDWRDHLAATYDDAEPLWRGWTEFVAVSYGASRAYDMFVRQLRNFCGIRESDPPAVIHERLNALVSLYPSALHERMHQVFGVLLGDTLISAGLFSEGETFQRELRAVVEQMAEVQSSQGPVVYVIDDVHWADVSTLEVMRALLPLVQRRAVLFLFAMRPDWNTPGWQFYLEAQLDYPEYCASVYLEPLTAEENRTLVRELLNGADAPERVYELIERKAEGNPFFIEETVRTLIDSGALRREDGRLRWVAGTDLDRIAALIGMPGNVQALLTARIDQLEPQVRRTLQLASVIGRSFPLSVLERISERPAETLEAHLKRLAQADLVRPSLSGVEAEYAFRHALTRDATYETILLRQRRRYHRRVGEAIEAIYADRLTDEAPRLAYQFQEGRDWAKAARYYVMAGEAAARLYANSEALEHFSRAMSIYKANPQAAGDEQLIDLYRRRGRVLEVLGRYEDAISNYKELERMGIERGDPQIELEGLMPQAVIYVTPTSLIDAARGRELAERIRALSERAGRPDALARAHWCLMLLFMNAEPDAEQAVENGEMALELIREHGYKEIEAYVLNDIARAYGTVGRSEESFKTFARARQLWREAGDEPMMADSLGMAGTGYILYGDLRQAAELAREGLEISRRIGNRWSMALNAYTLGYALLEFGEISQGLRMLESATRWASQANFVGPEATIPVVLSWIFGKLGVPAYRQQWREESIRHARAQTAMPEAWGLWQIIDHFNRGELEDAVQLARQIEIPTELGGGQEAIFTGLVLANVLLAGGFFEDSLVVAGRMLTNMARTNLRALRADLLAVRAQALAELGRTADARTEWRESLAEARRQGARRAEWPALSALSEIEPDETQAADYRRQAAETIHFLAGNMDEPELRDGFLRLPAVRRVLDQV